MDRKQPLLLVILIVLFGVAIAGAIWVFGTRQQAAHRDQMISDVNVIASDAYQYRFRPARIGGGGGSYFGYQIPSKVKSNEVAHYDVVGVPTRTIIEIEGVSDHGLGTIVADVDSSGHVASIRFTGKLQ